MEKTGIISKRDYSKAQNFYHMANYRPRKYSDNHEDLKRFVENVDAYFRSCYQQQEPPNLFDLSISLGFACTENYLNYLDKPLYSDMVRATKTIIAGRLVTGSLLKQLSEQMAKYMLSNQHGLEDKRVIDNSQDVVITVGNKEIE